MLKFYIHKIWEDVKKVVIGGFRPPLYLTYFYFVQRFYFYEKKTLGSFEQYLWQPIFSVKIRTKNGRLHRTWFGYNNSEMLLVKCCIFFNLRLYWLQPA